MNPILRLLAILELSEALQISAVEARKILNRLTISAKQIKGGM